MQIAVIQTVSYDERILNINPQISNPTKSTGMSGGALPGLRSRTAVFTLRGCERPISARTIRRVPPVSGISATISTSHSSRSGVDDDRSTAPRYLVVAPGQADTVTRPIFLFIGRRRMRSARKISEPVRTVTIVSPLRRSVWVFAISPANADRPSRARLVG